MSKLVQVKWESISTRPVYPRVGDEAIFTYANMPVQDEKGQYLANDEMGITYAMWYSQIKPIAATLSKDNPRVHVKFVQGEKPGYVAAEIITPEVG